MFTIDVSHSTQGRRQFNLESAYGEPNRGRSTYRAPTAIIEQDPSGIGAGYAAPQYWASLNGVRRRARTRMALSSTPPQQATVRLWRCTGSSASSTRQASAPTWSKVADTYENGAAKWTITIDNSASNAIERTVAVMEDDYVRPRYGLLADFRRLRMHGPGGPDADGWRRSGRGPAVPGSQRLEQRDRCHQQSRRHRASGPDGRRGNHPGQS